MPNSPEKFTVSKLDAAWGVVERFGTALGIITLTAAGPTGQAIGGGVTALYYVIPLSTLALFFLWAGYRKRERDESKKQISAPIRREYSKERLKLSDLVEPDNMIRNTNFTDCVIEGPAVICGSGGYLSIYEAEMIANNPDSGFIVLPEGGPRPDGAIGLKNCILTQCRFHNIAIASTHANVNQFRSAFGLPLLSTAPPHPSTQSG